MMAEITHTDARTCLVTAVDFEFKTVVRLLTNAAFFAHAGSAGCRGQWKRHPVSVLRAEMGAPGFGPKLAAYLAAEPHDAVIVIGLAGGLSPQLRVGDTVIYDRCLDARSRETSSAREEIASIAADDPLSWHLRQSLCARGARHETGLGVTTHRIATTAAEKRALVTAHPGALAVDLESYEVLRACAQVGIPSAVLRVISDGADADIPDFNRAYDLAGRLRPLALLFAMAARPAAAMRLVGGMGRVRAALRSSAMAALDASLMVSQARLTAQKPLP